MVVILQWKCIERSIPTRRINLSPCLTRCISVFCCSLLIYYYNMTNILVLLLQIIKSISFFSLPLLIGVAFVRASLHRTVHDKINMLAMGIRNVFNLKDFKWNKVKIKQRSFEHFIDTFSRLFYADLFLIWMNNALLGFCLPHLLPSPAYCADNFMKGVY